MSDVSGILLAILAMAALLGALIGGAVTLLFGQRHIRRLEAEVVEARSSSDREAATRLAISQQTLERERQASQDLIASLRSKEREAVARHDALQVHSRTQARRIEALQGEQLAAEERQMRLDRALHTQREELGWTVRDRSAGQREPDVSARLPRAGTSESVDGTGDQLPSGSSPSRDEGAVPVLRHRNTASSASAGTAGSARSRLASGRLARGTGGASSALALVRPLDDGDFPALSEADLPDSVEGLDLDGSRDARTD